MLSLCPTLAGTNCLLTLPGIRIFGEGKGLSLALEHQHFLEHLI